MKKISAGAIIGVLCASMASAVSIESYGPFDIYYYGLNEVWNGITNKVEWTSEQKTDINAAINEWDRVINNLPVRQIKMHLFWDQLAPTTLGGSASEKWYDGSTIYSGSELVWREGYNADASWDTFILYNNNFSWNFGAALPGFQQYDFRSVVTHEIGHSLGWFHSYDPIYDDFGFLTDGFDGLTTFERFLVDSTGNSPFNGTTGAPGNFNERDNPVFFTGTNATALYGGPVPVYAPTNYASGSSLSHLDTSTFPDYTMSHAIANGATKRSLSDLEIAMMADMGWDVIPEPSPVIMVTLVCAAAFWIRRRFPVY
jgi:hypothetical protein